MPYFYFQVVYCKTTLSACLLSVLERNLEMLDYICGSTLSDAVEAEDKSNILLKVRRERTHIAHCTHIYFVFVCLLVPCGCMDPWPSVVLEEPTF